MPVPGMTEKRGMTEKPGPAATSMSWPERPSQNSARCTVMPVPGMTEKRGMTEKPSMRDMKYPATIHILTWKHYEPITLL
jgi:hypothetical protein